LLSPHFRLRVGRDNAAHDLSTIIIDDLF
jgi:hypothetical protein